MVSILRVACSFVVASGAALANDVIVVARNPGPGIDYTSLQLAIDSAQAGDVVLVKEYYGRGVTISGKSVHVVAALGETVVLSGQSLVVSNIAAGQTVVIRGITCLMPNQAPALMVTTNQGSVWIEDCKFLHTPQGTNPPVGARITDSSRVVLTRCKIEGGGNTQIACASIAGNTALEVLGVSTRVALQEVTLNGGEASHGCAPSSGSNGGDALRFGGAELYVGGCQFYGGNASGSVCPFGSCPGGNGGNCIVCTNPNSSQVWVWNNTNTGGKKGSGDQGGGDGKAGAAFVDPFGVILKSTLLSRRFVVQNPSTATQSFIVSVEGKVNDAVWMWVDLRPTLMPTTPSTGLLHTASASTTITLGTIGAAGSIQVNLPVPPLPSMVGLAVAGIAQAALLNGAGFTLSLGSAFVVLDPSL